MPVETRRASASTTTTPQRDQQDTAISASASTTTSNSKSASRSNNNVNDPSYSSTVRLTRRQAKHVEEQESAYAGMSIEEAAHEWARVFNIPSDFLKLADPEAEDGVGKHYLDVRYLSKQDTEQLAKDIIVAKEAHDREEAEGMRLNDIAAMEQAEKEASSEVDYRTPEEHEAISYEIAELESEINISKQYKIVDRLGEGTFSSVYKAIDCKHAFYDNHKWAAGRSSFSVKRTLDAMEASSSSGSTSKSSSLVYDSSATSSTASASSASLALKRKHKRSVSSSSHGPYSKLITARKLLKNASEQDSAEQSRSKVYVALKRIYVTSSPQRIWNELDILGALRTARNTAYLISAIRHEDQVIAVMPYERHQDFRTYYRTLSLWQMQAYFKCLFAALADCHDLGIMHRDVKPANFLFNIQTNTGTLCDFGLAQRFHPSEWVGRCLHSQPVPWANQFSDIYHVSKSAMVHGEKLTAPIDTLEQLTRHKKKFDQLWFAKNDPAREFYQEPPYKLDGDGISTVFVPTPRFEKELKKKIDKDAWKERWHPVKRRQPGTKIGFMKPEFDKRPTIRANRAGTRGFRAPEVVLKCPDQTMALDIWSVGVTMLCFLTRRFPFFTSNDDTEALVEIAAIFGKKRMEKCGALHNRTFLTNIPTLEEPIHKTLHDLVRALNPNIFVECMPDWARAKYTAKQRSDMLTDAKYIREMDVKWWYTPECKLYQAVDLMKQCLALDLTKRVTAADALFHPFITDEPPSP